MLFSQIAGAWQIFAVRFCLAGGGGELLWLPSGCVSVPVFFFVVLNRPCGSWIANNGGPAADLIFCGIRRSLWERACSRWRSCGQPDYCRCARFLWELACQRWRFVC
ncbi:hypothetical protein EMIT0P12_20214 [Pseudomonas sp. IT-P12]